MLDRRYVEIIADHIPAKVPKRIKYMFLASMLIVAISFLVYLKLGDNAFWITGAGAILFIMANWLEVKHSNNKGKEFLARYDEHNELPPYPEK